MIGCCEFEPAFERLLAHKKSSELLIERLFTPTPERAEQRHPEFHAHLRHIHEAWQRGYAPPNP